MTLLVASARNARSKRPAGGTARRSRTATARKWGGGVPAGAQRRGTASCGHRGRWPQRRPQRRPMGGGVPGRRLRKGRWASACAAAGHVARAAGPGGWRPHRATAKRGKPAPPGGPPEAAPWRAAQVHEQVSARAEPHRQGYGLSLARAAAVALGPKSGDYRAAVFQQDLAQLLLAEVTVTRRGVRQQHEMTRRGPRPGKILRVRAPCVRAVPRLARPGS